MFEQCPKCGHHPLPRHQALPAACPRCGVILAKVRAALDAPAVRPGRSARETRKPHEASGWTAALLHVPGRVDALRFWGRCGLWLGFVIWGLWLIGCDHRTGELGQSFLHGPLLVFHEAGHVVFMFLGRWMMVLGGTLGQLLVPAVLFAALLKRRDTFGAAIGLWFVGVSLLDVAPYVYDALHPQLVLLGGATGEAGGHDWIYLLSSLGWLPHAQRLGGWVRGLGALVVLLSLAWAAGLLWRQRARVAGDVLEES